MCSKDKKPTPLQDTNVIMESTPTNQTIILIWKKNDQVVLAAIWDCLDNIIFSHVGACQFTNKAWLDLKTSYSISGIITQAYLQKKFIIQKYTS